MKDRLPTKPGRVALTDEDTNVTKYYILAMADDPVEEGTGLNKASLLTDATAALFGLTSAAVPDDVLALIATGRAQIEVGTYDGTGTYGSSNKNTLTFGFSPKMVIISGNGYSTVGRGGFPWFTGETSVVGYWGANSSGLWMDTVTCAWNGNTVQWYSGTDATRQLNQSGKTYYYCAIG